MIFTLNAIPLSVLNRALELSNQPPEQTTRAAWIALQSVESRISADEPYTPLVQAVAEYMIILQAPYREAWSLDRPLD